MNVPFLDLKAQYQTIKEEIDQIIQTVLNQTTFIKGEHVQNFESEFAQFHNAEYCLGVGNGTDALEIAIESMKFPKGSEIIVPANSFIASSEAVTRCGHRIVFCDCDKQNYTISIPSLKSKITQNTRAIIAVHLYGHPCDMDKIIDIASKNKIKIIEDCAQSHGAKYKGNKIGTIGDIGAFSFYPGKNLGAYGDGGAIITNDKELVKQCTMIANHGRIDKYNHEFEGRNSRLDGLQAAILSVKLKYLDSWTNQRIKIANYYSDKLQGIDEIVIPKKESWAKQVYHLYVIRAQNRDGLQEYLKVNGISTGVHYPISLPKLKAYNYLNQNNEDFFANNKDVNLLSLPIYPELKNAQIDFVIEKIKQYVK